MRVSDARAEADPRERRARSRSAEELRSRVRTLVFTPDRLAVVKGGPADAPRVPRPGPRPRCCPPAPTLPAEYGAALGQRNAAPPPRRAPGVSDARARAVDGAGRDARGRSSVAARARVLGAAVAPRSPSARASSGSTHASLAYDGEPPTADRLDARLDRDLERGTTALGPHLDEIRIAAGDRDLRTFGSQGEQRMAVLVAPARRGRAPRRRRPASPPLLLLDDVLSELDGDRRRAAAAIGSATAVRRSSPRRAPRRFRSRRRSCSRSTPGRCGPADGAARRRGSSASSAAPGCRTRARSRR